MSSIPQYLIKIDEEGHEYAVSNPEYQKLILKSKYKAAGIPDFYCDINWEDYVGEKSKAKVEQLKFYGKKITDPVFNYVHLYLWSVKTGSQKTAVACNILKECIAQGLSCRFITASELIHALLKQQGYASDEAAKAFIERVYQADVLVLDEIWNSSTSLFWQKSSDLISAALDEFIRTWVSSSRKLIMTSNNPPPYVLEKYGANLYALINRNFEVIELRDVVEDLRSQSVHEKFMEGVKG